MPITIEQFITPEAWERYGAYTRQDPAFFDSGHESPAGRALVNAQVRLIELYLGAEPSENPIDDKFAYMVVEKAALHGHCNIKDILGDQSGA